MIVGIWYGACIVASEIIGIKTVPLIYIFGFQLHGSVALLTLPIIFTVNDAVAEVYGIKTARSLARSGILVTLFLSGFIYLSIHLPPSTRFIPQQAAYQNVLSSSLRMTFASICAFGIAEILDVYVFKRLHTWIGKKHLWLRSNGSNIVSQFADTAIFMTVAFFDIQKSIATNVPFLASIILPYWFLKCTVSFLETPFLYIIVKWLRYDKENAHPPFNITS